MKNQSLTKFINEITKIWGPINSQLTKQSNNLMQELATSCLGEEWVNEIIEQKPFAKEVYRSEEHGFILLAHIEQAGDNSPAHDHGNGWVIYATVQGQSQMGIFHQIIEPNGALKLVQKDQFIQQPGDSSVYLTGDIHDTKALENNTLTLRLTSCDFNKELKEGRLIRYFDNAEKW